MNAHTHPTDQRRRIRRRLATLLGCASVVTVVAFGPAAGAATGTTRAPLNVRQSATTASPVITSVPNGTNLNLQCYTYGAGVSGLWGYTTLWHRVSANGVTGYVSDGFVYTGTNGPAAGEPACGAAPAPAPSTTATWGQTVPTNLGYPGNCTWWSLEQFKAATGVYGRWYGNAKDWAGSARSYGWTVTTTPRTRSIVVFQPGVAGADRTYGHTGWVLQVSGNNILVSEMNATAGFNRVDTRWVANTGGMSYILAP